MLSLNEAIVGAKVRCLCDFPGVPMDTVGQIVEDYDTGIMVAWDLPDRPLPAKTPAGFLQCRGLTTWAEPFG